MRVYFDNAATTPLDSEVKDEMVKSFDCFGNPSSIHKIGRESKVLVEESRKKIASLFNCSPGEIIFTSGGTEAINACMLKCVSDLGIENIVVSKIEHLAVLESVNYLMKNKKIKVNYLDVDNKGRIDIDVLESKLKKLKKCMLVAMHGNNEIGNLYDIKMFSQLCKLHGCLFFSDTVQTIGHYKLDFQKIQLDFAVGSAHKFHGPKGIGFLYANAALGLKPLILGGSQERNMRAGTENLYGVVGLAKAIEVAYDSLEKDKNYILSLKKYMIDLLKQHIKGIEFNGVSSCLNGSLYTILNVLFPETPKSEMLLFNLDIEGVCASGGSACSSGTNIASHVLYALNKNEKRPSVRFSFSKKNTKKEIDFIVKKVAQLLN